ncbi:uncharacterized protein [Watersipora subatra]|uniref:uncharacterized protein n=1 Tax=Watersipora subatra TaxID=2589382 RepID=UPI00355C5BC6
MLGSIDGEKAICLCAVHVCLCLRMAQATNIFKRLGKRSQEWEALSERAVERKRRRVERKVRYEAMRDEVQYLKGQLAEQEEVVRRLQASLEEKEAETKALRSRIGKDPTAAEHLHQPARSSLADRPVMRRELMLMWQRTLKEQVERHNPRLPHYLPRHPDLPHPKRLWEQLMGYLDLGIGDYFGIDMNTFQVVDRTCGPPL